MTRQELENIKIINDELKHLERELWDLRHQSPIRAGIGDGMPRGSGTSDPTYQLAEAEADLVARYEEQRLKLLRAKARIEGFIATVPDPVVREAMRYRYEDMLPWKAISSRMRYAESTPRMLINRYLDSVGL